jgi:hypothetical protein
MMFSFSQNVTDKFDEFARMRVGRQPHHHRDAPVARKPAHEDASAQAVRLVVILDVVEHDRGTGARPLRQPRDGAKLDVPIDLRIDLVQFASRFERFHPAAHVAEGDRFTFNCHAHSLDRGASPPKTGPHFSGSCAGRAGKLALQDERRKRPTCCA